MLEMMIGGSEKKDYLGRSQTLVKLEASENYYPKYEVKITCGELGRSGPID